MNLPIYLRILWLRRKLRYELFVEQRAKELLPERIAFLTDEADRARDRAARLTCEIAELEARLSESAHV